MAAPSLPDPRPQTPQMALRVAVLGVVALAAFGVLVFRLWALQVLANQTYQAAAQRQSVAQVVVRAERGAILDANGKVLVTNRPGNEVQLDPNVLDPLHPQTRMQILRRLQPLLKLTPTQMLRTIAVAQNQDPHRPVTLARDVDRDVAFYLAENPARFPGVSVAASPLRYYPYHKLAAHIFGALGPIGPRQIAQPKYQVGYDSGSVLGLSGLEGRYDAWLRGHDGTTQIEVDASQHPTGRVFPKQAPVTGDDLRLTIDVQVQQWLTDAVQKGIELGAANGATAGAAVALDPKTGAIKALVSLPTYDPNWLISRKVKRFQWGLHWLFHSPEKPAIDRAIQGLYPAASTFKPFTAIAALHAGVLRTAFQPLLCSGRVQYYKQPFSNWDTTVHQWMSLPTALERSCDTFFYQLGKGIYDLGPKLNHPIQDIARKFGFGRYSGIDIKGENAGLLPTPEWKHRIWTRGTWDYDWHPGDSINLAIGQGNLEMTPLQLAVAYAAIANGGTVVTPHIGARIESGGQVVKQLLWPPKRHIDFPGASLSAIRQGLELVTHSPDGTGEHYFANFPIDVAGKTGTAEVPKGTPDSLFASYAPANNPQLVVVVIIEHGGHGGEAAAPAALQFYAHYFGQHIPPIQPVPDPSR